MTACSTPKAAQTSAPPAPEAVRALTAESATVPLEVTSIGNVEAISSVEIKSRITSPILRVHFSEGQDVKQGDLLFELDAETINRQIAEIDATILRDAANAKQAEANILRDQATLRNLQSIATRTNQLLKEGVLSKEQAGQAVANSEAAAATVDAVKASLDSARAAETADRARLQQARLQLEYTKIKAPLAGRAGVISAKQGNLARENDNTLVTLLQVSPVYVSFPIPENLLTEVRKYNSSRPLEIAAVTSDNRRTVGTLQFIDNTVDSTTGTIRLKATFNNSDRALWPGQFVNVTARLNMEKERVLVVSQALQTGPRGKYVWVLNPTTATVSMRPVTVLRLYSQPGQPEKAVVGEGLQAGEQVISEGQMRLVPNAKVRLLQPNETSGN
ncbi:MAG: efflux RND transporter periplasmic adaptor subunit [Acidobacteriia bacterium]|nr:efflux RND transporter periplasmic adaptor subunit [Terriglobia bacterium]